MIWIRCKSYRALPISIPRKRNNPGKGATNSILTPLSCKARTPISRTLYWILRFQSHRLSATAIFVIISYHIIISKLNLKFNQISDIMIWSTRNTYSNIIFGKENTDHHCCQFRGWGTRSHESCSSNIRRQS